METNSLLSAGSDGFYHPRSEGEVRGLILRARREGKKLRVRGAGHSTIAAIYTDGFTTDDGPGQGIDVMLDQMATVTFDDAKMQVTAQAGCHLGLDPSDPTGVSTLENSLFYQLERRRWAFPDTGGITHQTVAGFLSTGSSGGSLSHSVGDQIVSIRFIDGLGEVHEVSEAQDADLFYAAGVSMGLLGVICAVKFQCVPRFDVIGQESTREVADSGIDFFGQGSPGKLALAQFLREKEHARLMWWPQQGVQRMVVWQGRTMLAADYTSETGPQGHLRAKPYAEFPLILGKPNAAEWVASEFYDLIRYWNAPDPRGKVTRAALELMLPPFIKLFVSDDGDKGPQRFWDAWLDVLPMDNVASDKLLPTRFTEMWFPLEKTVDVMTRLRDHFNRVGLPATGPYACEIYATKRSRFWMSPAFDRDVVKIDHFWFTHSFGDPSENYYPQFWELLKDLDYRLHWGKYLPKDSAEFLPSRYPHWRDFMEWRRRLDPLDIFLTAYWRTHLVQA
jgi:FAD/FMN-containing dehydrogenase